MFGRVLFCTLWSFQFYRGVRAQGECTDLRGRLIAHGLHYVPGPDTCTLCVCDNGMPKVCKAVLCSPPQDCRSFRVGHTCCEFICLDDVVKPAEAGAEASVRLAAGGTAALVLLAVALVVYRIRTHKRRRPPHADDQRSLTSIGYISGSMGYMGGTCETALATWKPPGNYLPRGEAPPPYDEVVAQCRPENNNGRVAETAFHRAYVGGSGGGMGGGAEPLREDPHCAHGYANMPRFLSSQMSGVSWFPVVGPCEPGPPALHYHFLAEDGSGSAYSGGGAAAAAGRAHLAQTFQHHHHPPLHRTIPRLGGAGVSGAGGASRAVAVSARRSFHRAPPRSPRPAPLPAAPTSMPRNLNLADAPHYADLLRSTPSGELRVSSLNAQRERLLARSEEGNVGGGGQHAAAPPAAPATPHPAPPAPNACAHPTQTLPLAIDKPSCVCSYAGGGGGGGGAAGGDEPDDYRAECENCKSATSSRWCVSEEWEEGGTQTLQRATAPPAPHGRPVTHTLPQPNATRHPNVSDPCPSFLIFIKDERDKPGKYRRTMMGTPSNWENWFNTIPDSDSESEEE